MNLNFKLLIAMALTVISVGCAKEKAADAPLPTNPPLDCSRGGCPPGATPPPVDPGYNSGSSAALQLSGGSATLAKMFYNSAPNNPQNVRINIDLRRKSESVIISYTDGGRVVEAALGVVHPYSGHSNEAYNGWVNQDGKTIWKGFFQDTYGAVILVVDKFLSQGDGQSGNILGGSIWFQNFNRYAPNNPQQGPLKMCWEITLGPYDCRSFLVNNKYVIMNSTYYPTNKGENANMLYEKLGDFNGIAKDAAGFN